jgi:hypothetical protein
VAIVSVRYYAQLDSGKLLEVSWVTYELLVTEHGWVHRLKEPDLAIVFRLKRKKKKWNSQLKSLERSGTLGLAIQVFGRL